MYTDPSIKSGISKLSSLNQVQKQRPSFDQVSTNIGNKFTGLKNAIGGGLSSIALNPATLAATGGLSAIAPAALAVGKLISGKIKQNKADASLPQYESPEERALASYATRRKRAFQTGTATAAARNQLASSMKTGIANSFKVGGGAKGLNMMTNLFNQAQLGLNNQNLAGELQFAQMEKDQKTRLAQRKLELGLLKYNTMQARAAQTLKEGKATAGVVLAKSLGIPELNPYANAAESFDSTGVRNLDQPKPTTE